MLIKYVRKPSKVIMQPGTKWVKQVEKGDPIGVIIAVGPGEVSWSLCKKGDKFNKELAKIIAVNRLAKGTNKDVPTSIKKEFTEMQKRSIKYFKIEKDNIDNDLYIVAKTEHHMSTPHPNGIDVGYTVVGKFKNPPIVGERFIIEGSNSKNYLNTSPVTEITENGFKTRNSTYTLYKY